MRLFVLLIITTMCLSGCSRKCFMLFNYRCEKVENNADSTKSTKQASHSATTSAPQQYVAPKSSAVPQVTDTHTEPPLPDTPCGPEEVCQFNIDLYSQWLARKINSTLIQKDYLEQNITLSPKCERVECLPPPFHNSFEGKLQDNLLFYGVGVRQIANEKSLSLRYQAQVVPIIGDKKNQLSKLILTTTIIKNGMFIFSNTSMFTINKWDAWQYRVSQPATVIPITGFLPKQSVQQVSAQNEAPIILEPQPFTPRES